MTPHPTPVPNAPLIPLRAGPLRLAFDPASGFLRRIRLGTREVLRGIYAAVRDRNWGTVPTRIANLTPRIGPDTFQLDFEADCRAEGIHFVWHGTVQGFADGGLRYDFAGEARSDFLRNRIGFCVLHPPRECAGAPARQLRTDGSIVHGRFPDAIEPQIVGQASFRDLRAVAHEVLPGHWAELQFEGDVFEMEDQRNWTDASFKTYCTPLARPFPVAIQAGTRLGQSVTLRWLDAAGAASPVRIEIPRDEPDVIDLTLPPRPDRPLPRFGLGLAGHGEPLTEAEIACLRALRLTHLRADLRLATPDWPQTLDRAAREAERLGLGLELALHLPPVASVEWARLRLFLARLQVPLARLLVLGQGNPVTTAGALRQVRESFAGGSVPCGAGSDANFCELNREQALSSLPLADADFVFWAANPQVHASDELSIMETIEAQADLVRTARAFAGDRPLVVTPVTLKPRFNAVATDSTTPTGPAVPPATIDPRQSSLFAAAWTLGTLAALAEAGIASATFYETTGPRGLLPGGKSPSAAGESAALDLAPFPVCRLFQELAGADRFASLPPAGMSRVAALAVAAPGTALRLLLANLSAEAQRVRLVGPAPTLNARLLHAGEPDRFLALPHEAGALSLPPYALAAIEPG